LSKKKIKKGLQKIGTIVRDGTIPILAEMLIPDYLVWSKYLIIRQWKRRDKMARKEGGGNKGEQDKKAQGKVPH
jgi:hypothetical protein